MNAYEVVEKSKKEKGEIYELYHDGKSYLVESLQLGKNWDKKVIVLPDGTILDAKNMAVDYTDRYGHKLAIPRLIGRDSEYKVWGRLPILEVVVAKESKK